MDGEGAEEVGESGGEGAFGGVDDWEGGGDIGGCSAVVQLYMCFLGSEVEGEREERGRKERGMKGGIRLGVEK